MQCVCFYSDGFQHKQGSLMGNEQGTESRSVKQSAALWDTPWQKDDDAPNCMPNIFHFFFIYLMASFLRYIM